MTSKTLTTVVVAVACILMFPVMIGIAGGLFGVIMGIFGAGIGLIGAFVGTIFGTIGGLFGWIFGGCHLGFFHGNIFAIALFVFIIVIISKRRYK